MKFKKFIIEQKGLRDNLYEFFAKNPNPPDSMIHTLSDVLGISPHDVEAEIYSILSSFMANGRYNESGKIEAEIPEDELKAGIEVEYEHTTDKVMARRIAMDHLAEIPGTGNNDGYYSLLKKMEDSAKKKG
jgi:hypothetical protein